YDLPVETIIFTPFAFNKTRASMVESGITLLFSPSNVPSISKNTALTLGFNILQRSIFHLLFAIYREKHRSHPVWHSTIAPGRNVNLSPRKQGFFHHHSSTHGNINDFYWKWSTYTEYHARDTSQGDSCR